MVRFAFLEQCHLVTQKCHNLTQMFPNLTRKILGLLVYLSGYLVSGDTASSSDTNQSVDVNGFKLPFYLHIFLSGLTGAMALIFPIFSDQPTRDSGGTAKPRVTFFENRVVVRSVEDNLLGLSMHSLVSREETGSDADDTESGTASKDIPIRRKTQETTDSSLTRESSRVPLGVLSLLSELVIGSDLT